MGHNRSLSESSIIHGLRSSAESHAVTTFHESARIERRLSTEPASWSQPLKFTRDFGADSGDGKERAVLKNQDGSRREKICWNKDRRKEADDFVFKQATKSSPPTLRRWLTSFSTTDAATAIGHRVSAKASFHRGKPRRVDLSTTCHNGARPEV